MPPPLRGRLKLADLPTVRIWQCHCGELPFGYRSGTAIGTGRSSRAEGAISRSASVSVSCAGSPMLMARRSQWRAEALKAIPLRRASRTSGAEPAVAHRDRAACRSRSLSLHRRGSAPEPVEGEGLGSSAASIVCCRRRARARIMARGDGAARYIATADPGS